MKNYRDFLSWAREVGMETAKALARTAGISNAQIELWELSALHKVEAHVPARLTFKK